MAGLSLSVLQKGVALMASPGRIGITGANGYIGTMLIAHLQDMYPDLVALSRQPSWISARYPQLETRFFDAFDVASCDAALADIDTLYYLIHSMQMGAAFAEAEATCARNVAQSVKAHGRCRRIIYLGGIGDADDRALSPHLASRARVEEILRESGAQILGFQASVVIGNGSTSFELIRALTERLPMMVVPKWVDVMAQPIAIDDVLAYLSQAAVVDIDASMTIEIGGQGTCSYLGLMQRYAALRGLRRYFIRIPVLTPWLSSLWLGLVTPVYSRVGRKLIESIRHPSVVRSALNAQQFAVNPMSLGLAMQRAISAHESASWAQSTGIPEKVGVDSVGPYRKRFVDRREVFLTCSASAVFSVVASLGGATGWYSYDFLWRLRGYVDLLVGGVGLRRGRPVARDIRVGDTVDWWRVLTYVPGQEVSLLAEMKVPGRATLSFTLEQPAAGGVRLVQEATFEVSGFWGALYWYLLYPVHAVMFAKMLRGIAGAVRQ
jgi:uncharacterized protein YbjT (DUF2867 family)